jgi:transcription-repair coupling factor (superfamily II helicase)
MFTQYISYELCELIVKKPGLYIVVTPEPSLNIKLLEEVNFFRQSDIPLLHFPDWETLPYDLFSPHQDIVSSRLKILSQLPTLEQGILFISIHTLMQKLGPIDYILSTAFHLKKKDIINLSQLKNRFIQAGYQMVSEVVAPGEFAVRGSLFDIFPSTSKTPFRLDLFDNEIESIRIFDPETQRSLETIDTIDLLPAREFPFDEKAIDLFREKWRENFEGNPMRCPLYTAVSQGGLMSGIEYYFPLFFNHTQTLFDYLPPHSTFIKLKKINAAAENFIAEIKNRYESLRHDITRPLLKPELLFLSPPDVFTKINQHLNFSVDIVYESCPQIVIDHKLNDPFENLNQFVVEKINLGTRILFCAESKGRREALLSLLHKSQHQHLTHLTYFESWNDFLQNTNQIGLTISTLENALSLNIQNQSIFLIPENLLLGEQISQSRRTKHKSTDREKLDYLIKNLNELTLDMPVVHIDHGVGRYKGLQCLDINYITQEFLVLEYANQDKLYVPVNNLEVISRYSGLDPEHAPLHKLGSDHFEKAKKKAAEQICDTAAELLEIHAKRQLRPGIVHSIDTQYELFSNSFPYEETLDQTQAIESIIEDMKSDKSMDRLICGDVGFGKTEVAMRAAFIAVQNGFQVSVLVPTTLLAQQHYQTFLDRFSEWPIKIDMISRFRTTQEQKSILLEIQQGKIDIIIGTHKLLQPDFKFKRLGLLIIDEEHRFGVRQKEQLKSLRAEVDILTLTATPIPRTLNMSIAGMRDLSIISTPPLKRLSIKTFLHEYDPHLIREAILREILRGGQVFYLHNNVETMLKTSDKLKELLPEARIVIAHGQMPERELEKIMRDFYHQHYNVLICTTIIETGIDIPTANTIIIERADKFGMAQLHQLRGRVGRSHHQAYAYLLTPLHSKLTKDAEKRLEAITQLEDLGAGFSLATHDMEIRGAGEILGENQSGNMQEIGFSLYLDLLDRAVKSLKKYAKTSVEDLLKPENPSIDLDLQIPALIPDHYLPDAHTRLVLYKRIAHCKTQEALDELKVEFIDRFGLLPEQTKNLFLLSSLKLKLGEYNIIKAHANDKNTHIEFRIPTNTPASISKPDPLKIILLIQKFPTKYKLEGQDKVKILTSQTSAEEKINTIEEFLEKIS